MDRNEKERIVAELTERFRETQTLIVADYRGLSTKDLAALRRQLSEHGARFAIVKNTLTRRAAEAAGAEAVLALLEGPTALAFLETDGDPVPVAKALRDTARTTRVLALKGGVLEGRGLTADEIERVAALPSVDVLRGEVLAAVIAPLNAIVALVNAPLRELVGLLDARIEQLGGAEAAPAAEPSADTAEPEEEAPTEATAEAAEPAPEAEATQETETENEEAE